MLGYAELMSEIVSLVESGATGTLFVRTQETHMARLVFDAGNLVGATYRVTHGRAALPLLRAITQCTTQFTAGYMFPRSHEDDLPSTAEVLATLGAAGVDPAVRVEILTLLGEFIGSSAESILDDVAARQPLDTPAAWHEAIDRLATEIEADQAPAFIAKAKKIVGA